MNSSIKSDLKTVCPQCLSINRLARARLNHEPVCGRCKKPLLNGAPLEVNSNSFARLINQEELPLVVDFWAPWCGPCKIMAPAFAQAAQALRSSARLIKLNTEDNQVPAQQYQIRSIPTVALFIHGEEVDRRVGALSATAIEDWIRSKI